VHTKGILIRSGIQDVRIDVASWSSQVYIIKAIGADGKVLSMQKFVKQ
jgi:hypothetical protein